jgi:hypothetical protein
MMTDIIREVSPRDLYREAVIEGTKQWWAQVGEKEPLPVWEESVLGPVAPEYWIARYAARKATDALLEEAKRIGLTEEQWEALRQVASDVAYD